MPRIQVEYVRLDRLKPDPANPMTHPPRQIAALVKAIETAGFINPILTDQALNIIAGHGRLIAARQAGLETVPVIRLKIMTEAQRKRLRIADNRLAQLAEWDKAQLASELRFIVDTPDLVLDAEAMGFSIGEIDVLLSPDNRPASPDDDRVPATASAPVSQAGDIWILDGRHRIGCGDCRDRPFLARLMEGKAQAVFTDPPYNVRIDGHVGGKGRVRHREFAMASGEMSRAAFVDFLTDALGACVDVSSDGAIHFVCMDHHHVEELLAAGEAVYDRRLNICVWNKSNAGMGGLYRSKHELVMVYAVDASPYRNNVELGRHGRHRSNVWDYPSVNTFAGGRRHDLALHPTVKPTALVADAIKDVTRRDDVVLDAFLGSGTTLIACERTGRLCRGVEIDPLYVDLALRRWRDLTGGSIVHAVTGRAFDDIRSEREAA